MEGLNSHGITLMFLAIGILLGTARLLGELAQRFRQPAVLGELIAGVLLGPTVLGHIAPSFSSALFGNHGPNAVALNAITSLSLVLFLLVAGMEVDLSIIWKQGKTGFKIGIASMILPFVIGYAAARIMPDFLGRIQGKDTLVFSLFFATALSISALPVIARTLMDMDLYRSDLGMVVISSAIFNDLVGWIIFAITLGLMDRSTTSPENILTTIVMTLTFAAAMLTLGRALIHKTLPFLQAYTRWPGGVLGFALTLSMFGAAFTEWIGIHAIFGSFIVGVAIGDSSNLRERTRVTIDHFVSSIFAPVFFASIGLRVDFFAHFNLKLTLVVLVIACFCKLAGGYLGARWSEMDKKEGWAVGFALNSRGAMEIILGILALNAGIIPHSLFVALVVMAIVTSMMSGPIMRVILGHGARRNLHDAVSSRLFLTELGSLTRKDVINEIADTVCSVAGLDSLKVKKAVWAREESLSTGIGNGVAIPHARIDGLSKPVVAVGFSDVGIDFDAPDGNPASLIFMILTPLNDSGAQLELVSEIARLFKNERVMDHVMKKRNFTDFLAFVNSAEISETKPLQMPR